MIGHIYTVDLNHVKHLRLSGVDMGPLERLERVGRFEMWKRKTHKFWDGIGRPWASAPAKIILVEMLDSSQAKFLDEVETGRNWRQKRKDMYQKMLQLDEQASK